MISPDKAGVLHDPDFVGGEQRPIPILWPLSIVEVGQLARCAEVRSTMVHVHAADTLRMGKYMNKERGILFGLTLGEIL